MMTASTSPNSIPASSSNTRGTGRASTGGAHDSGAPIVTVGGGFASAKFLETLRTSGYDGPLTLIAAEPHHAYERPPLSKTYLRGEADRSALFTVNERWYADRNVEVLTGATVASVDPASQALTLDDGRALPYRDLLLATGSTPRLVPVPGLDLAGVLTLRSVESADLLALTLHDLLVKGQRLTIIGDGWIGLEVAASARSLGVPVTVIGRGAHPLARAVGTGLSDFYVGVHRAHGVDFRLGVSPTGVTGKDAHVTGVDLSDGSHVEADALLIAVGAAPNVGLAAAAGLDLIPAADGGGVAVDATLATSAPHVYAAGDIASIDSARYARRLRFEHWARAAETGTHAARTILGDPSPFEHLPYFFSDQYDIGMEATGLPEQADDIVVSGSVEDEAFVAFWLRGDRVQGGIAINTWDRQDAIADLVRAEQAPPRAELEGFVSLVG